VDEYDRKTAYGTTACQWMKVKAEYQFPSKEQRQRYLEGKDKLSLFIIIQLRRKLENQFLPQKV